LLKKVAAVSAAIALGWGLGTTPASASSIYVHFKNAATGNCLDYRSDYGPYATGCNGGGYQTWLINNTAFELSELRQNVGDRLCMVARSGEAVMRPCLASDAAALWVLAPTTVGFELMNNVTKTCLGEQPPDANGVRHVKLTRCTGGNSQLWAIDS
jgi:hypothetical protein